MCDIDQVSWLRHPHFVPNLVLTETELKEKLVPFVDHLTSLNYQCVFSPPGYYTATHATNFKFAIYWLIFDGLTVVAPFDGTPAIVQDEVGFVQFLNRVNSATGAGKYYYREGRWMIQASYSGDYERGRFEHFLESFFLAVSAPRDLFSVEAEKYFGIPQTR